MVRRAANQVQRIIDSGRDWPNKNATAQLIGSTAGAENEAHVAIDGLRQETQLHLRAAK